MSRPFQRDEQLFADALAQPASERDAFLRAACGGDGQLLARLVALIAAHEGTGDALKPPLFAPRAALPTDFSAPGLSAAEINPGEHIGRYKLTERLGDGGCGVVYLAEQEADVRRLVALKVIKPGMDTREVIARFGAERQALALMDHPGIAKVFDAGATASGRPFFAMELVRGLPINQYCDSALLSIFGRLELIRQVCDAVQHAHQKGIIHRDLKPSNLLVANDAGRPVPKVIDFGIAKATQGRLTEATLVTSVEQLIGTPAYMSPEQAGVNALDIDIRTDVYSLGVVLYVLLIGRLPFEPKAFGCNPDELRRMIREVEPARPSDRFASFSPEERARVAELRDTDPVRLRALLAGDLDSIVMKALEKDRSLRYESAAALADDVGRYLEHRPVVARPASATYRLGKFVRRNRLAVAAAAAIAFTLVVGTFTSMWQAVRAREAQALATAERSRAVTARTRAETLLGFMLGGLRTEVQKAGKLDLLDMVGEQATAYFASVEPRDLSDEALGQQARSLRQIGEVQIDKARYAEALNSFEAAYARAAALVARHPDNMDFTFERAQAEFYLGFVRRKQGDLGSAIEWLTRYRNSGDALARADPGKLAWRRESVSGHHNLAVLQLDRGNLDEAQAGFATEIGLLEDIVRENPGDLHFQFRVADVHTWLATVAERRGAFAEAAEGFARQVAIVEGLLAKEPLNTRWRVKLADGLALRTFVLAISGRRSAAAREQLRARSVFDALVAQDPANLGWLGESLIFRLREALLAYAENDPGMGDHRLASAREGLEKLAAEVPTDRRIATYVLMAWRIEAERRYQARSAAARDAAARAVQLAADLVRGPAVDDLARSEAALVEIATGQIAAWSGEGEAAQRHWQRAAELVLPPSSTHWRLLDPAARILALLGRTAESRSVIERLRRSGYEPLTRWPDAPP